MIALFFSAKASHRLIILGLLLGLNLFALLLTYSRGSWVAIRGLLLLTGWKYLPGRYSCLLCFQLESVNPFWELAKNPRILPSFHSSPPVGLTPDSYHGRWILTKFTLEKIKENPFQMNGFGRRSFAKKFHDFVEKYQGAMMWHAHNTFLNIALQTGLQGLILFCFLLYRL